MNGWPPIFSFLFPIFVATIVYRWQKGIDRRTSISIEMRKEYANFWNLSQSALKVADKGNLTYGDEATGSLIASLSYIDIYGEPKIYNACNELFNNIMLFSDVSQNQIETLNHPDLARNEKIALLRKWMELNDKLKAELKNSHQNHLSMFPNDSSLKWLLGIK